ncbi:hypothetical protein [Achromobacter xylosoxidans]|uniref:hypothetical protein n=1 Tax=Alcaligenes xylosoxydans xylosoxydans TaxID=85698 RepID=UPI000B23A307|nr:hypothetical protein [Achromobacter xylosoxidans]
MAADWIKMRVDLPTHPKVVRIASACKADRLRVVGGLLSVWGLFDAHSVDGQLEGYTPDVLDETIGFPGFSVAMIGVGWLEFDGFSLWMPQFEEHNGQSAKKRAQDADRKRNDRNSSASQADKKRTREEKNREEEKKKDPPISPKPETDKARAAAAITAIDLQARGVELQVAADFLALRAKKRAPVTATALAGLEREAAAAGMTLNDALRTASERGWQGFKAEWVRNEGAPGRPLGSTPLNEADRRKQEFLRLAGHGGQDNRTFDMEQA